MADDGSAGGGGNAALLSEAVAQAITDVGVAGSAAAPKPLAVSDRSGAAVSTVSLEFVLGDDGRIYGQDDEAAIPEGPRQKIDIELIKSAFGWIGMAQVRGPRRTECVGWSGAGGNGGGAAPSFDDILDALPDRDGKTEGDVEDLAGGGGGGGGGGGAPDVGDADQLGSLLSSDPRSATTQALAMLQAKGCLASARAPLAPIAVDNARANKRRRGSLVGLLLLLLGGTTAFLLAVALRPDTTPDTPSADGNGNGSSTDGTSGPSGTGGPASSTTGPGGPVSTTGTGDPNDPGGDPDRCSEFAVAFSWTLKPPPYPLSGPPNPYAGQEAVAELSGNGLPSSVSAVVGSDGSVTFGPFLAGAGPWSATLTSVGGQSPPTSDAPSVLSTDRC